MSKKLLMANEAFAQAALEAGVNVVAGYPGTPSSEVIETIAKRHASGSAEGVHVEWSSNEAIALGLLAGAAYTGARTLFTCKQVGMNVASDPLMSLNYVGVKGGTVIFVADDPGPISSQTEQDTRRYGSFAKVPVFDPATPEQGYAMMQAAFELSERYATPVIFRPTTRICHASSFFEVAEHTQARPLPEEGFVKDPKWVIFPPRAYAGHGEVNERLVRIARDFDDDSFGAFNPAFEGGGDVKRIGILAGGISAAYAREALRAIEDEACRRGVPVPGYRFLQVGTPYPFPQETVRKFADGLERIIVFEELDHFLEDQLLALAGRTHASYDVFGKLTGTTLDRGENSTDVITVQLADFLGLSALGFAEAQAEALSVDVTLPNRPPVLCPGCPHRGSFYACKQAVGKRKSEFSGDIGCYTLGNAAPLNATDTCLCMGAGISMAQGFSVTQPDAKHLAFVGDSTFFASGLPGVVNAYYNQHDVTIVVLDNSTTAMTGSQPHPGTGQTLMGPRSTPVSIEGILRAIGYECITKANPYHLDEAVAAAREAIDFEGPSAVIFKAPCISLVPAGTPVSIDADACTGCKKCLKSIGCPALSFDVQANVVRVDATMCNGCGLCTHVCPFDVIEPGVEPPLDVSS
ncbi:MAG: 4Fe-4S dicluster domain-containing protein [Coriobacteriaceae bacterium]|nr:4Fe-4S dicluster domain-containing protein [Coriobacteriaceae bacterium]